MHELSIMTGIIRALLDEIDRLERKDGTVIECVKEVVLEIGELTFLGMEQLRFCYSVMVRENRLAGSELIIRSVPGEVRCTGCGYSGPVRYQTEFHLATPMLVCPRCEGNVEVVKGRECAIRTMRLDIRDFTSDL